MVKLHLRVGSDLTTENDPITQYVQAATRFCEERVPEGGRTFLNTTYDLPVSHWWFEQSSLSLWSFGGSGGRQDVINGCGEQLPIPLPPLSSVTWIKYYDGTGTLQTLASTYYLVRTPRRQEGSIERAPLQVFPAVAPDRKYPITIRFVAGYGDGLTTFPPVEIQQAILLATTWMFEDRGPSARELASVDSLLQTVAYGAYA